MWHLMTSVFAALGPSIKETPVPRTAPSNPAKSPNGGACGAHSKGPPPQRLTFVLGLGETLTTSFGGPGRREDTGAGLGAPSQQNQSTVRGASPGCS